MADSKPRKAASKAPAAKKPAVAKRAATRPAANWIPGPEERYRMVQQAAYFIAERHKFNGNPMDFWSEAEAQIFKMLSGK